MVGKFVLPRRRSFRLRVLEIRSSKAVSVELIVSCGSR
jgi:hypothetical protein